MQEQLRYLHEVDRQLLEQWLFLQERLNDKEYPVHSQQRPELFGIMQGIDMARKIIAEQSGLCQLELLQESE